MVLLAVLILANMANSSSQIYLQDGSPYISNGSATTPITFIDALDDTPFNITSAFTNVVYSFPNLVLNGNFTGGSGTSWSYAENDPSGRATSAFLATGGDIEAGRWRFRLTDGSNSRSFTANGNLTNSGVNWDGSLPAEATLNFSFIKSFTGTSGPTSHEMSVYLLRPDGSQFLLWQDLALSDMPAYSRISISVPAVNFNLPGTYSIRLFNRAVTPVAGRSTIEDYWDQISLVLKKPLNNYAVGVLHNSTQISMPANLNNLISINATLRFRSDFTFTPSFQIYNFASSSWSSSGCTPSGGILANTWYSWECAISSSPADFISADGFRRILVRLYSPTSYATQFNISEDYLSYNVTYVSTEPYVSASKPSYSSCGIVFYEARFYDKSEALFTPQTNANITILNSSGMVSEMPVLVSGGIYQGSFALPANANSGNWLIKALAGALGKKQFFVRTGNSDVWKIEILPSIIKGAYSSGESVPVSINVINLKGIGVTGLVPGVSLLFYRDAAPYAPAVTSHGNGTYSFNLDFASLSQGAPHKLVAIANSGSLGISSEIGFYVS
ncbi:MAG: hypothetical protein AABX01_03420 [Candidatus Micrarchaeota archaeon]